MTRQLDKLSRAWIEIDLGALVRNGAMIAERAGVPLLPMVKAGAYGLGAVPVARALERLDPWGYGVATVVEGAELRAAGIARRILVATPLVGGDLEQAHRHRLTPSLGRRDEIERWRRIVADEPWHLSIDTGMSRAGVHWMRVHELHDIVRQHPPEGAFTHFHSADRNDGSRELQERRFREAVERLPMRPRLLHAENGAAIERVAPSAWDLVRPGIVLYGVGSGPGAQVRPEPVIAVRARIVDLRWLEHGETVSYGASYRAVGRRRIATLPLGYADGYRRALGNRGTALLNGRRAPVAGVVTMDMTMLDVTDIDCGIDDVATLVGSDGGNVLDAETVALAGDLSPYELLTGFGGRLEHVYRDAK